MHLIISTFSKIYHFIEMKYRYWVIVKFILFLNSNLTRSDIKSNSYIRLKNT